MLMKIIYLNISERISVDVIFFVTILLSVKYLFYHFCLLVPLNVFCISPLFLTVENVTDSNSRSVFTPTYDSYYFLTFLCAGCRKI
jgi:hypothetical protein